MIATIAKDVLQGLQYLHNHDSMHRYVCLSFIPALFLSAESKRKGCFYVVMHVTELAIRVLLRTYWSILNALKVVLTNQGCRHSPLAW